MVRRLFVLLVATNNRFTTLLMLMFCCHSYSHSKYFNLFDMLYILVFHQTLIGNCMISHFDVCSILLLIEISFVYHISVLMVTFVL